MNSNKKNGMNITMMSEQERVQPKKGKTKFEMKTIDYRCEDGRFPVCTSCVTISNPDLFSRSETGVNPGLRS